MLIDASRQRAEDAAHVGDVGETAGGEPLFASPEVRALRDDADVGARQPRIDEFARLQPRAVGDAARGRLAADDGNDVRCG